MRNPYDILGIPQNAEESVLREAYRRLARQHEGNIRKMNEINDAYDSIVLARGGSGYSSGANRHGTESYASAPDFADVRSRIGAGRFDDALTLLDGTPQNRRGAEWYYLKGCAQRGRGWLEEAEKHFAEAARMDPGRQEYRAAYDEMRGRRQGSYRARQESRRKDDDDGCCKICGGLICADCCCECMGGDLIPCC